MSFSVRRRPHKPLRASHLVIHSQTYSEQERDSTSDAEVKPCGDACRNPSDMKEGITKKSISHLWRVLRPTRWWCLRWQRSECLFRTNGDQRRKWVPRRKRGVICMFNSSQASQWGGERWYQWSARQCSGQGGWGSPLRPLPPDYL